MSNLGVTVASFHCLIWRFCYEELLRLLVLKGHFVFLRAASTDPWEMTAHPELSGCSWDRHQQLSPHPHTNSGAVLPRDRATLRRVKVTMTNAGVLPELAPWSPSHISVFLVHRFGRGRLETPCCRRSQVHSNYGKREAQYDGSAGVGFKCCLVKTFIRSKNNWRKVLSTQKIIQADLYFITIL